MSPGGFAKALSDPLRRRAVSGLASVPRTFEGKVAIYNPAYGLMLGVHQGFSRLDTLVPKINFDHQNHRNLGSARI